MFRTNTSNSVDLSVNEIRETVPLQVAEIARIWSSASKGVARSLRSIAEHKSGLLKADVINVHRIPFTRLLSVVNHQAYTKFIVACDRVTRFNLKTPKIHPDPKKNGYTHMEEAGMMGADMRVSLTNVRYRLLETPGLPLRQYFNRWEVGVHKSSMVPIKITPMANFANQDHTWDDSTHQAPLNYNDNPRYLDTTGERGIYGIGHEFPVSSIYCNADVDLESLLVAFESMLQEIYAGLEINRNVNEDQEERCLNDWIQAHEMVLEDDHLRNKLFSAVNTFSEALSLSMTMAFLACVVRLSDANRSFMDALAADVYKTEAGRIESDAFTAGDGLEVSKQRMAAVTRNDVGTLLNAMKMATGEENRVLANHIREAINTVFGLKYTTWNTFKLPFELGRKNLSSVITDVAGKAKCHLNIDTHAWITTIMKTVQSQGYGPSTLFMTNDMVKIAAPWSLTVKYYGLAKEYLRLLCVSVILRFRMSKIGGYDEIILDNLNRSAGDYRDPLRKGARDVKRALGNIKKIIDSKSEHVNLRSIYGVNGGRDISRLLQICEKDKRIALCMFIYGLSPESNLSDTQLGNTAFFATADEVAWRRDATHRQVETGISCQKLKDAIHHEEDPGCESSTCEFNEWFNELYARDMVALPFSRAFYDSSYPVDEFIARAADDISRDNVDGPAGHIQSTNDPMDLSWIEQCPLNARVLGGPFAAMSNEDLVEKIEELNEKNEDTVEADALSYQLTREYLNRESAGTLDGRSVI